MCVFNIKKNKLFKHLINRILIRLQPYPVEVIKHVPIEKIVVKKVIEKVPVPQVKKHNFTEVQ